MEFVILVLQFVIVGMLYSTREVRAGQAPTTQGRQVTDVCVGTEDMVEVDTNSEETGGGQVESSGGHVSSGEFVGGSPTVAEDIGGGHVIDGAVGGQDEVDGATGGAVTVEVNPGEIVNVVPSGGHTGDDTVGGSGHGPVRATQRSLVGATGGVSDIDRLSGSSGSNKGSPGGRSNQRSEDAGDRTWDPRENQVSPFVVNVFGSGYGLRSRKN